MMESANQKASLAKAPQKQPGMLNKAANFSIPLKNYLPQLFAAV
jgi:hypothetical protein